MSSFSNRSVPSVAMTIAMKEMCGLYSGTRVGVPGKETRR